MIVPGIDISLHCTSGLFKMAGGNVAEVMYPTVYVAVCFPVYFIDPLNYTPGLLRCCGIVKIDIRLVMNKPAENGEVPPYFVNIESQNIIF